MFSVQVFAKVTFLKFSIDVSDPMAQQNSFSKEDLVKAGTGEMFGAGNSQLPSDNMLMMDRIISITDDGG